MKTTAISVLLLGLSATVAFGQSCDKNPHPIQAASGYDHTKWIESNEPGDIEFSYGGFVSMFDGPDDDDGDPNTQNILAQPEWVAHEVRRYVEGGVFAYASGFKRPRPWYEHEDTSFVDAHFGFSGKKIDRSYSGEGHIWNRGHMATRSLVNRLSSEAGCNTHFFL